MRCSVFHRNMRELIENEILDSGLKDALNAHMQSCIECREAYERAEREKGQFTEYMRNPKVRLSSIQSAVMAKVDEDFYTGSFLNRFKIHLKKYGASYAAGFAVVLAVILISPQMIRSINMLQSRLQPAAKIENPKEKDPSVPQDDKNQNEKNLQENNPQENNPNGDVQVEEPNKALAACSNFEEGIAVITIRGPKGQTLTSAIDTSGKELWRVAERLVYAPHDGVILMTNLQMTEAFYVDARTGKPITNLTFSHAQSFVDGFGSVIQKDGTTAFLDKNGKIAYTPPQGWKIFEGFFNGYAKIMDTTSRDIKVLSRDFQTVYTYNEKEKYLMCYDGKSGIITYPVSPDAAGRSIDSGIQRAEVVDGNFKVLKSYEYNGISGPVAWAFQKGYAALRGQNGLFGIIDRTGEFVVEPKFTDIWGPVGDDLYKITYPNKHEAIMDVQGKILFQIPDKIQVNGYGEELLNVLDENKQGGDGGTYMDLKGNLVLGSKYTSNNPFSNGLALTRTLNGHWIYIDKQGNTVIDVEKLYAKDMEEMNAKVQ